ncbi:xanthine dehydrogenase YagT iron-sulfur-binding subunit [Sagittula marina]|uniref:Xanthine dehydrogenase YagT iron-sulfur-binding subunit n=1 Tax=Sagittula marina TaxID=943940 RepID=A0A7W6GRM5_9RHOB|nr:2Fe-2S iron-sulfur cluster-binding protein [Sagittula marina]MBB3984872.1 xanthine dehydrogenase YagT iron-sulfur-binding subunit [Sagittula marina]
MQTKLTVNGEAQTVEHDPRATLLDTLRDGLGLSGTKKGCDHGQCGACTVLLDGERVNSCLCLTAMHDGQEVTTIEGIGSPDKLSALQKAFVEKDGYQCGYCTPGQIMSATALLQEMQKGQASYVSDDLEVPKLTDDEMAERMSGNLCRCSAYPLIREAIAMVADQENEGAQA